MKYLIKNITSGEETICEKVVVDGFEYYIKSTESGNCIELKKIATNNSSLDLPMVVDEVGELAINDTNDCPYYQSPNSDNGYYDHVEGFRSGYQKAKETFEYTKDDMVEFGLFCVEYNKLLAKENWSILEGVSEQLLKQWQQQRIKTILVE